SGNLASEDSSPLLQNHPTQANNNRNIMSHFTRFGTPKRKPLALIIALVVIIAGFFVFYTPTNSQQEYPYDPVHIKAKNGAVSSENSLCSNAGVDMLKQGGSAVDAAIATSLCIGVTNMYSSGIGGGGFMLLRSANGSYEYIDFREEAPAEAFTDMYNSNPKDAQIGGLSVAVPGEIRGFELAHKRHGKLPWAKLFQSSIEICEQGWHVTAMLEKRMKGASELILRDAEFRGVFAPNGVLLTAGQLIKRPKLGKALRRIAEFGPDEFYVGEIAKSLVNTTQSAGGILTMKDMSSYQAKMHDPLVGFYHGRRVITTPAPSSGGVILSILNILEGFNLQMEGVTGLNIHRLIESWKFGFAQRSLLGDPIDPIYTNISQIEQAMLQKENAAVIRKKISSSKTFDPDYYSPKFDILDDHGTMHVSVLTAGGDAVSLTSTVNLIFGAQIMDPEFGIILNDEMDDFSIPGVPNAFGLAPSPYNFIHPFKRPLSSCVPVMVEKDGEIEIVSGASGGSRIITSTLQNIVSMMDFGMNVAEASKQPRLHHQLSPNEIMVEYEFDAQISKYLEARGHKINRMAKGTVVTGVESVRRLDDGTIEGSSTIDISDPAARSQGKRGVFSELLTNPEESIDDVVLVPGHPPPIPPLEGLLGGALRMGGPRVKSFRKPGWKHRDGSAAIGGGDGGHGGRGGGYPDVSEMEAVSEFKDASGGMDLGDATVAGGATDTSGLTMGGGTGRGAPVRKADEKEPQQEQTKKKRRLDYQKALEPKVFLPFESRPGQTPRKIEIERRKRLYAAQKIEELVAKELAIAFEDVRGQTAQENKSTNAAETMQIDDPTNSIPGEDLISRVLPLSAFDNTEYDQRKLDEWLDMRPDDEKNLFALQEKKKNTENKWTSMDGVVFHNNQENSQRFYIATVPIPGKALCAEVGEGNVPTTSWKDCLVTAYDNKEQKWKVKFITFNGWELDGRRDEEDDDDDDADMMSDSDEEESQFDESAKASEKKTKEEKLLICRKNEAWNDRINIVFLSEDPFTFAKRVAEAYRLRDEMAAVLRYNFIVDCMPTQNTLKMPADQLNRIQKIAGGETPQLQSIMKSRQGQALLDEVSLDFCRSLNKQLFDAEINGPTSFENYGKLRLPRTKSSATEARTVEMPQYDFEKYQKEFSFVSFLTKLEVIRTLAKIRIECDKLLTNNLFLTSINKIVRLDEFEQMQNQSLQNVKTQLKEGWIPALKSIIKTGFKEVGKGWYNMHESSLEVYRISKLKKFMTTVKFIMQDSLRFLVLNSLTDFIRLIHYISCQRVVISGTNDVRIFIGDKLSTPDNARRPLFQIDLTFKNGKVGYSTDLTLYESSVLAIFDKAMSAVENLPQLEPMVLDQMFWATKPNLQIPHTKEATVVQLRDKLKKALENGIAPLEQYLRQYDRHLKLLNLDIAQYSIEYEDENHTVEEMERDINSHMRDWEALDKDIPSHICLGLFWVSCDSIRSAMRKDLARVVLEILSRRTAKLAQGISQAFSSVQSRLKDRPTKIEELTELREYMKTIPEVCRIQNIRIQEMLHNYDILEKYRYEQSNEDFRARWQAYAWPMRIEEMLRSTEAALEVDEAAFLRNLASDQEVFKERIHQLSSVVADFSKYSEISRMAETVAEVHKVALELKECQNLVTLFNSRERLFGQEVTHYEEVAQLMKDFEPYKLLWLTGNDWVKWHNAWLHGSFLDLNAEDVEKNLTNAWRTMFKSVKHFKNIPGCLAVASQLKDEMDEFKPYLPLIQALRNPVCDVAGKEYSIEAALDKMDTEWKNIALEIIPYKDTGTFIMRASDEIVRLLDDHIVMTQSMSFSPFKKPFAERIALWESKLRTVQEVLEAWMACQRSWLYLEPIFGSDDIITQLPVESKRFTTMDRTWRRIMSQAKAKPGVVEFCSDFKLLDSFRECNKLLELVSKGLSAYLESKRIAFPRFFFLSDDELLQILSQTKDPMAVQPHLRKAFENVASLEFQDDKLITAMFSAEGERINVSEPFYPKGAVEEWLLKVEDQMRKSVKKTIMDGLSCYHLKQRTSWVLDWPGQVVLSVSQTYWTKEVSEALKTGQAGLKALYARLLAQLQGLVSLVRGELPFLNRLVLGDLIVIDVHARDVVKKLIDSGDDDLRVKIVNANFRYGYEYLGNTGRLVITPLTDRCYLTLSGAMHLGMGGAPAGPAGTGKTETVKDLAKALAKQCVVFNCSDQLDYLAMAKFFKGLAAAGAWACFDEFNRIDIEVLSVIAQQITTIQKAAVAGQTRFLFEGVELPLDPTNAIFITMNPGYAGRTELPDNLKALFRPVAMMIPNYAMIGEISLFSFGFSNAKILAEKMVATFKLSSEQLSSQDHYDFGMRAVKTVISSAGNLKREQPNSPEDLILLRALCDVNLPKFLADDVPLFNGIISDLFPGVEQPKIDYGEIMDSMNRTCEKMSLQPEAAFIKKCIQLYETTIVRHGLMLVGPTGGGKTSCLRVLSRALSALQGKKAPNGKTIEKVRVYALNPKSITMGQLYGEFDPQTHEWTDGIFSSLMREGVEDTTSDKKWYVFDGPVDAVWVESMNTLLDDNKKLCLSSGEIIKMSNPQTIMFEVENLAFASPATVSRCGMIYMEPGALGVAPLIKSWLTIREQTLPGQLVSVFRSTINPLFDYYLEPALRFLRTSLKEAVPTTDGNITQSLMRILTSLMSSFMINENDASQGANIDNVNLFAELMEPLFIFALIWSVGATTDTDGHKKFDGWFREHMDNRPPMIPIPTEGLVYDYVFDQERKCWLNWMEAAPEFQMPAKNTQDVIVPTMDTIRNSYILNLLLNSGYHVLCTGPTGTGKSVTIQDKIMKGMDPAFTPVIFNFSARTSANQTQDLIDSKLEKRRKGVFGPPVGKRYILFIDDLNMPMLDICLAQPPIELLRQWMDYGGWYDRKNVGKFMEIVDITFVCAMGPPGGGRNPVTHRFVRQFNLLSFVEMDDDSLGRIFTTILGSFLQKFPPEISVKTDPIVNASIHIYNTIRAELLPTPAKSHYTFNLRDMAKVVQGVLSADLKTVNIETDIVRLWIHECMRVFQDRLVDNTDKAWFLELIKETMLDKLQLSWQEVVTNEPLLYGDYMTPGADPKVYVEIKDMRRLVKLAEEYLEDYNSTTTSPMRLVMFLDAIEHVSRICRIIRAPAGNALLLGVGGSGRQSLSRLATFMEEYELFQIEISKNYGQTEWRDDLKKVLFWAGIDAKPTVFLFTDTQIFNEACLEDINNILNGGDVPNIYTNEEADRIMNAMRPIAMDAAVVPTRENLFALYIGRVKNNLHLIICMSPIGDAFRNRLRMFPSLVNCCTIDWFSTWPEEALRSVAANSVSEVSDLGSEQVIDGIVSLCVYMHESVRARCVQYKNELNRNNYVTPKSYLELLGLYKRLLEKKRNELLALRKRTATGLEKLLNATKEVEILQEELEAMQPMLLQTSQETEYAMKKIAVDKVKAEEMKETVVKEESSASKKAEETKAIAEDAKRDLDEALPALDAAVESLNSLTKNDVIEVRSMQRPPEGVKFVIEAICIMKGIKPKKIDGDKPGKKIDDYWEPGRALLADPQKFLDSLMNFDKDNIPEHVIIKIKPYIDSPEFQVSVISRVSKAATSMC
ncbi:Dynein heavy chain 1, axonemal, partial [Blyttiomyces sp. JEL0837]